MMDEEQKWATVDAKYLKGLEDNVKDYDWKCGYIRGIEDGIAYATEILRAMGQTERSE